MQRRRFALAALLVAGLAFSSPMVFADGGTDQPTPKPAGGSALYSEAVVAVRCLVHATSLLVDLMY
jgi:hypothetical protein